MTTNTTASEPFDYRQTGDGIFQVDVGDVHLGTVQKFTSHEWWAYPAHNPGQKSSTHPTREDAAQALRAHQAASMLAQGETIVGEHGRARWAR